MRTPFSRYLAMSLSPWIVMGLAGCAPQLPEAPPEGVTLVPQAYATRLDGPPGGAELSPAWQLALNRLLAGRPGTVRRASLEVQGDVAPAQRSALIRAVKVVMPMAEVTFTRGERTASPLAIIRYAEPIPNRCFGRDPWVGDGFLPPGCASALTLARMVADPRDFEGEGRP